MRASKKRLSGRVKFINSIFFMCISILIGRLAYIQLGPKADQYVSIALDQYNLQYNVSNLNYRILDDNNEDLINYKTKYIVEIKSNIFKNFNNNIETEKIFAFISILKNYNSDYDLIKKFEENPTYNFKFEVDKHTYDKLKTLGNIKGIYIYEYNSLDDSVAWSIENILIREIKEKSSAVGYHNYIIENRYPFVDFNNEKSGEIVVPPNNNNIKTTIDKDLQQGLEDIIKDDKYLHFDSIAVAISDVSTGEIKALTQTNEKNPNLMLGSASAGYVPGSIYKIVVAGAAIDSGVATSKQLFDCTNSRYDLCKEKRHGNITLKDAFAVSCNNIFAEIGKLTGWDYILNYSEAQGLFSKVLGFSDGVEVAGSYAEPKDYEDGPLFLSMGQNMLIEPLQALGIVNTILNEGVYKQLSLIDEIVNENGEIIETFEYPSKNVLKGETASIIKEMLINTVENGTGKQTYFEDVETGVKTGTTERFDGEKDVSDGWVLGYFKHRNKYYSMTVFIENINEAGQYGGNTAGPIFRDIVEYFVNNF